MDTKEKIKELLDELRDRAGLSERAIIDEIGVLVDEL